QGALEARRAERDADLLEQLVLAHRRDALRGLTLRHLHQHGRRCLADRAAAARELDVVDHVGSRLERDVDRDLVAAERVLALGLGVRALDHTVPARVLVVVEDDLSVEVVELAHANTLRTRWSPSTRRSISSRIVYR